MCIDRTNDMYHWIKNNAKSFGEKFCDAWEDNYRVINEFRVKVIAFGDYTWSNEPMIESPFFRFPNQENEFCAFFNSIEITKACDPPANALEAIALALRSDWTTGGDRRRHIILVLSDAPAHPLGKKADCSNYPSGLPRDFAQLRAWWEGTDATFAGTYQPRCGRLVAFVPEAEPWIEMQQSWNRYWPAYIKEGEGLRDLDFDSMIDLLTGEFL